MKRALPNLCAVAKTDFERKLIAYFEFRKEYPFELRYRDSTLYNVEHLPDNLENMYEFIPMWEAGYRVFMFKTKIDQKRAKEHFNDFTVAKTRKRKPRNRRPR